MSKGAEIIAIRGVPVIFICCAAFINDGESFFFYLDILEFQEEFAVYLQRIREGARLEEMPPSKYAEPPPLPPLPILGLYAVC